ncbi:MAG: hypothetical protein L3K15_06365 [Thermoplasmata archaeon]|nr:hypothetical protein [Thermoplasmata archaeon]
MTRPELSRTLVSGCLLVLVVLIVGGLASSSAAARSPVVHPSSWTTLPNTTLVAAPPGGAKGADDITWLASDEIDHGKPLLWAAYQNGINPNGTPGTSGGPVNSTVAGYDPTTGALVTSFPVLGKIDGLTADRDIGKLIATVNEDQDSALQLIEPATGAYTTYTFSPSPEVSGNGGTDSIAIWGHQIYITHSNPNDASQATQYRVTLQAFSHTALLRPLYYDNSPAIDVVSGTTARMGLTDPDSSFVMPPASPAFAGQLMTIAQADSKVVFAAHSGIGATLHVLNLSDNVSAAPPTDGFAVATADKGTLYVIDNKAGTIQALDTAGIAKGTVFIGEPKDAGNPLVGSLNLATGVITPFGNHFGSPKGLLFVAAETGTDSGGDHGHDGAHGNAHHDSDLRQGSASPGWAVAPILRALGVARWA